MNLKWKILILAFEILIIWMMNNNFFMPFFFYFWEIFDFEISIFFHPLFTLVPKSKSKFGRWFFFLFEISEPKKKISKKLKKTWKNLWRNLNDEKFHLSYSCFIWNGFIWFFPLVFVLMTQYFCDLFYLIKKI